MLLHIKRKFLFGFKVSVPFPQRVVNILLRNLIARRLDHCCQRGIQLIQQLTVHAVMECRHIKIQLRELHIAGRCDNARDSGFALQIGIFLVGVLTGVDERLVFGKCIANAQLVPVKQLLQARLRWFGITHMSLHRTSQSTRRLVVIG